MWTITACLIPKLKDYLETNKIVKIGKTPYLRVNFIGEEKIESSKKLMIIRKYMTSLLMETR